MRAVGLGLVALLVLGCGGSTDTDSGAGSGGSAGAGGGSGGSSGGSGGSGNSGGTGGSGGGGAVSGSGGSGGGVVPGCCTADGACPTNGMQNQECVSNVCKPRPARGSCWSDRDCEVSQTCKGGFVCPCNADCDSADQLGVCTTRPGCCATPDDCPPTSGPAYVCIGGNCERPPNWGSCWTDDDCAPGQSCSGACICPCGAICACGGQQGSCQ